MACFVLEFWAIYGWPEVENTPLSSAYRVKINYDQKCEICDNLGP